MIEDYIPTGHENAITISELCALTNKKNRDVRYDIEKARNRDVIILNMQDGKGYFQPGPKDKDLVKKAYQQEHKRAMSILASIKRLHAFADDLEADRCAMETTSS